ncbi:MAG: AgmX/PglI C-terminal domain-containing protein [Ignavibacteriae bacterium]|nr:AgmX/PglI C-terminal domain-containing protein [Ignavibacteriota bacterium]
MKNFIPLRQSRFAVLSCLYLVVFLCQIPILTAQDEGPDENVSATHNVLNSAMLSPQFLVNSDEPDIDSLILISTSVKANIAGVISDVRVLQRYTYSGTKPLEAAYAVPLSLQATMHGITIKAAGQIIASSTQDREVAGEIYDKIKKKIDPFFVEWKRANIFQVHISNVPNGTVIEVETHYTELLSPSGGIYQFFYPKTVKPRYMKVLNVVPLFRDTWADSSFEEPPSYPSGMFSLSVSLSAGTSVASLNCISESHKIVTQEEAGNILSVNLPSSEPLNKDFTLTYQLAGSKPQANLMLYQGAKENYFLLTLHPPLENVARELPPHEYIVLADSTVTDGESSNIMQTVFADFAQTLRPKDKINVVTFGSSSEILTPKSLLATPENVKQAGIFLEKPPSTGTEHSKLLAALQRCIALPTTNGYSRSIIIATNGYVSVDQETFDFIASKLNVANIFTVGIGANTNPIFFNIIGRLTMSEPTIISTPEEAKAKATDIGGYIQSSVLTKVKVDFKGLETYDIEPASYPDVFANRPVFIFGKWRGKLQGKMIVKGNALGAPFVSSIDLAATKPNAANIALQYLWARYRSTRLADYNIYSRDSKRVEEISSLGTNFSIQTVYTAFTFSGIDTSSIPNQIYAVVQQPLNLNQNSSSTSSSPGLASTTVVEVAVAACSIADADFAEEEGFITVGEITIDKGLSPDAAKAQIDQQLYDLQLCYATALHHYRHLQGKTKFRVVLDATGAIAEISLLDSELNIDDVNQCILDAVRKFKFTAPPDTTPAVTFLLVFEVI